MGRLHFQLVFFITIFNTNWQQHLVLIHFLLLFFLPYMLNSFSHTQLFVISGDYLVIITIIIVHVVYMYRKWQLFKCVYRFNYFLDICDQIMTHSFNYRDIYKQKHVSKRIVGFFYIDFFLMKKLHFTEISFKYDALIFSYCPLNIFSTENLIYLRSPTYYIGVSIYSLVKLIFLILG